MRLVGYTFDAAAHCVYCAESHYSKAELASPETKDREGNPLHAIHDIDEGAGSESCDDCGEKLL